MATKLSGYLRNIKPDDQQLGDRGFEIQDLIALMRGRYFAPPNSRKCKYGKKQRLNRKEVQDTRKFANLRIPVEIAIGRLKKFKLLANKITLKSRDLINKTVQVAAAFCNLLPRLIQ